MTTKRHCTCAIARLQLGENPCKVTNQQRRQFHSMLSSTVANNVALMMFDTLGKEIVVMGVEHQQGVWVSADLQVKLTEKHEQLTISA